MRWETVSATSTNEVYRLWKNDKKLLTLTLHPFSNSARVETADEKRVFLIRKEGFRRNKTVVRNEYGIKLGELGNEDNRNFIDVHAERFYYNIESSAATKLLVYKQSDHEPFIICDIDDANAVSSPMPSRSKQIDSHPGLLMALCWYMLLPATSPQKAAAFDLASA